MSGVKIFSDEMPLETQRRSAVLGEAIQIASRVVSYQRIPVAQIYAWLMPPILLEQIKLFYSESGICVGYLSWAYLTAEVADNYVRDRLFVPRLDQWMEGPHLWIIDFACLPGTAKSVVSHFRKSIGGRDVNYVRRRPSGGLEQVRKVHIRGSS
jgi:hemolysin-activating ACP:hemolysin acyltransferase